MSLKSWLSNNPVLAVIMLCWSMGIVTFATCMIFTNMEAVSAAVASCYAALLGIPPAAIALYKWRNSNGTE